MLNLPSGTEISKVLAKKAIYQKFNLNTAAREVFDADIKKITIVNEVSPRTTTLAEGTSCPAFFVLLVQLKEKQFQKKNIELLSKLIPQKIVFLLQYENQCKVALYHTTFMQGEWQPIEDATLPLRGLNMDTVWENIVLSIGEMKLEQGNTLEEQIAKDEEKAKLLRKIELLEKKARAEKQPKKKFEMVQEIQRLKGKLV